MRINGAWSRLSCLMQAIVAAVFVVFLSDAASAAPGWPAYGGDAGGSRYSEAAQITNENVDELSPVWRFDSGDMASMGEERGRYALEVTPILAAGSLIYCTPFNEIIALDPGTGEEKWRYDPQISRDQRPANQFVCRGVAYWEDDDNASKDCGARIFMGTNDGRLIAVDARSGKPCGTFGHETGVPGQVAAGADKDLIWPGEFQLTSPPTIAGNVVVIGSAISDNARVEAPSGRIRAYDARSGDLLWVLEPVLPAAQPGQPQAGQANAWAPMSYDAERGLLFIPTSSASPDFFGGLREGQDSLANSVVAVDAATGKIRWSYQTVHHDVWDYDLPAQPTLSRIVQNGQPRDVVIQATKTGFLFVLDRDTGEPVWPVEERAVPQDAVVGEVLSPTQPFPTKPPAFVPQELTREDIWGVLYFDRQSCLSRFDELRNEGLFTPPSLQGTILYPFTGGGANWGGIAVDEERQIAIVNASRLAHIVTLFPAADYEGQREVFHDSEVSPQAGAPYGMKRELFMSPLGIPCTPPPWGTISAIDLKKGDILWQEPLGSTQMIVSIPWGYEIGTPNLGGPLITAGGLVFIGAAFDDHLRAFDLATGELLWKGKLPGGGQATPMSYEWQGRQYVVIAAGGHARMGTTLGDSIMAFALPRQ